MSQVWTKLGLRLAFLSILCSPLQAFREGDFIHAARKAQYMQTRTNWHDLLGRHCPRFGIDGSVAMPILKPKDDSVASAALTDYKMQLSFDGERVLTPWLTIIGKYAPAVPMLTITFTRSEDELRSVHAEVHQLPDRYLDLHPRLVEEFKNATHWPKHVIVQYTFNTVYDVDVNRGLYVLYGMGLLVAAIVGCNALRANKAKLLSFVQDVTAEAETVPWKLPAKGD